MIISVLERDEVGISAGNDQKLEHFYGGRMALKERLNLVNAHHGPAVSRFLVSNRSTNGARCLRGLLRF